MDPVKYLEVGNILVPRISEGKNDCILTLTLACWVFLCVHMYTLGLRVGNRSNLPSLKVNFTLQL